MGYIVRCLSALVARQVSNYVVIVAVMPWENQAMVPSENPPVQIPVPRAISQAGIIAPWLSAT